MKTKLFICNTPYQLLMACNQAVLDKEDEVDVIISDHFSGSDKIVGRINNESLIFRKAYYVPDLNFCRCREEWSYRVNRRLLYGINIKNVFESFMTLEEVYDELWIANWEEFANIAWNYILKYNNADAKLIHYEDGYSSCFWDWREHSIESKPTWVRRLYEKYVKKIRYTYDSFFEYHVVNPELMIFDPGCEVKKTDFILISDKASINGINRMFGYDEASKEYNKRVIFFEESYNEDGIDLDDMRIVDSIASIVGKESIIIKRHPRSHTNRWKEYGYVTNENTSVPWEVIMLNQDMSDKVFINIMSGSVFSSYMLYDTKAKTIFLAELETLKREDNVYKDMIEECIRVLKNRLEDRVFFPKTDEELKEIIENKIMVEIK